MLLLVFMLAAAVVLTGVVLFVLGSLGLGSRALRTRLPVKSPVVLMHWGSTLFSLDSSHSSA